MVDVVRTMIERVAFRDIRSNRYRRSGELRGETVALSYWEVLNELIDEFREVNGFLPDDEVAIVVNAHRLPAPVSPNLGVAPLGSRAETLFPVSERCAIR